MTMREGYVACYICGAPISEDEAIWATSDGRRTMHGNPYCDYCIPTNDIGDEDI